jgi:tryptophan synthase alpha chain
MRTLSPSTTFLEKRIVELRQQKEILLMSHTVLGYPSFEKNKILLNTLVNAGVELIELQFPFSEPIADGPILMRANQESIYYGTTVDDCFTFARESIKKYPFTLFVITTYYNVLFKYGVKKFVKSAAKAGIAGIIIPDLPPEEAYEYVSLCKTYNIAAIFLFSPKNTYSRLCQIAAIASGMAYCVARQGVTGSHTEFVENFDDYVKRIRSVTDLPIGVGFGIQTKEDIEYLKGISDIAIIGTHTMRLFEQEGVQILGEYMRDLRK